MKRQINSEVYLRICDFVLLFFVVLDSMWNLQVEYNFITLAINRWSLCIIFWYVPCFCRWKNLPAIPVGIRDASVVTKGLAENYLTLKFEIDFGQIIATSHDLGPQMVAQQGKSHN